MKRKASIFLLAMAHCALFAQRHEMPSEDGTKKLVIENEYKIPSIEILAMQCAINRQRLNSALGEERVSKMLGYLALEHPQSDPYAVFGGDSIATIDSACRIISKTQDPATSLYIEGCDPRSEEVYIEMRIGKRTSYLTGQVSAEGAIYLSFYLEGDLAFRDFLKRDRVRLWLADGDRRYYASFDIRSAKKGYRRITK